MRVAISQPRYLPAINYLQRLYFSDLFVFLDNVQRQSRGWENRNKILVQGKEHWITIPITSSSRELIKNTKTAGAEWVMTHRRLIKKTYCKHPFYDDAVVDAYYAGVEHVLESTDNDFSEALIRTISNICEVIGFKPNCARASSIASTDDISGPEKLFLLCKEIGASVYISGPNGREYGILDVFSRSGIQVLFHEFSYPVYGQLGQTSFTPWLSFFDVLFNIGLEETKKIIMQKPCLRDA